MYRRLPALACAVLLFGMVLATDAGGALLNVPTSNPDIMSDFILIKYVSSTDVFTANGIAEHIAGIAPGSLAFGGSQSFSLAAVIDSSGQAISGGFTITGSVPILGISETVLLSGVLSGTSPNFGYDNTVAGSGQFEFIFQKTGGALSNFYSSQIDIKLSSQSDMTPSNWSFAANFSNDFGLALGSSDPWGMAFGTADTRAVVPEPASLAIWSCVGLVATGASFFRRKRAVS